MTGPSTPEPVPSPLDRAGHRRTDPDWLTEAWETAKVIVIDLSNGQSAHALVRDGDLVLFDAIGPEIAALGPVERSFLGVDDAGTPYFAVTGPLPEADGAEAVSYREVGHKLNPRASGILVTALALANWHARHPFSPASGRSTSIIEGGWTRVDEAGGQSWPRTDPAVIMVVHDGVPGDAGRCLLGSNVAWAPPPGRPVRYWCLAGFVEPGESAEEAVTREVFEEVGVWVTDVRYFGSQPWPYPGSLMLGFTALADPTAPVRPDATEIASARWFTRAEIRAAMRAHEAGDLLASPGLPMGSSIAHRLVRAWADLT